MNKKKDNNGIKDQAEELNVGKILKETVVKALTYKSSDIHFEPAEKQYLVRFRVDGLLRDVFTISKDIAKILVFKVKVSAKLRTDEHFAPQDGRIRFDFDGTKIDTRVSIIATHQGEKIVFRLLSKEGRAFTLADLGMSEKDIATTEKSYTKPHGMIVAAGPTGSGKTSTLYSILKTLNTREKNIMTIEDPIEYGIEGVNHIQVNEKANVTFANGLRAVLRQDPDIIMIGEIRDSETAKIAVNSAMTGHLVLSTIHTNDSVTTIPRFVDMGVEPYLVSSTLNLVIAQRLARKLCEKCKQKVSIDKSTLTEIEKFRPDIVEILKISDVVYQPQGCAECENTGFKGRVGIFEILEITKEIREQMTDQVNSDKLFKIAKKKGLVTIIENGINKVKEGLTSISEVMRITSIRE